MMLVDFYETYRKLCAIKNTKFLSFFKFAGFFLFCFGGKQVNKILGEP